MRITKTYLKDILKLSNVWNKVIKFDNYYIRGRMWDDNCWQIVDSKDFDTANIILEFHLQSELINYLYNKLK